MNTSLLNESPVFSCPPCGGFLNTVQHYAVFGPVILIMAARGCHLTVNLSMGHNKLFATSTYVAVFSVRAGWFLGVPQLSQSFVAHGPSFYEHVAGIKFRMSVNLQKK